MDLGIDCRCEGLLQPRGALAICTRCKKEFQLKDLQTILKLVAVMDYVPSSASQKPPTEEEKHSALTAAVRKLIKLGLKVLDLDELRDVAPPPVPRQVYRQPVYRAPAWGWTTTGTTWASNGPVGNIYVHVTIG